MADIAIHSLGLPAVKDIWCDDSLIDGSIGSNRAPQKDCQIKANNDYEAALCWLHEYRQKPTTYRSYQKEAERLLLWSITQHHKPLASLNRDDF